MAEPDRAAEAIVTSFIKAFAQADYRKMAGLLAQDVESYVTSAEGGVKRLDGRDAYMQNIEAFDYATVRPSADITQILTVKPGQVMVMVEIKAKRKGRELHNFAAFLMDVRGGEISKLRMVEAMPAYSDEFWNA